MLRFSTLIWNNHKNARSVFARSPEGVKHMDVLNKRASRALPRAKTGSGAVAMKRQQTLVVAPVHHGAFEQHVNRAGAAMFG